MQVPARSHSFYGSQRRGLLSVLRQVLCWLQDGAPLRLNMWGFNLYTEGHFDLYIADYYDYKVSAAITPASPMHS